MLEYNLLIVLNEKDSKTNLREALRELDDFRRGQGRMHTVDIVMMIVIMGTLSGCFGYRALGDFVKREEKMLRKYLQPKNGKLPSFLTLWRVMTHIDEKQFLSVFENWVKRFHPLLKDEIIALDGKALHGTKESDEDKKLAHLVSFFAIETKETLCMAKTVSKSNEIPLVREMILAMRQEGLIYTMDALHAQKETLQKIIDNHCDYIVGVKGNQKKTVTPNSV